MKTLKTLALVAVLLIPAFAQAVPYKVNNKSGATYTIIITGGSHNEGPYVSTVTSGNSMSGQRDCANSVTFQPVPQGDIIQPPFTVSLSNQVCHHGWEINLNPPTVIIPATAQGQPAIMSGVMVNLGSFSND